MKVILIQEEGKTVGWTIEAENTDERLILGSIRNKEFWGIDDQKIQYNGMTSFVEDERYVQSIQYATKAYVKAKDEAFIKSLKEKHNK